MTKTPYIGYGGDQLENCLQVEIGDWVLCPHCGEPHQLFGCDDGSDEMLFYRCGNQPYLAGIMGRLVVGIEPCCSGQVDLDELLGAE